MVVSCPMKAQERRSAPSPTKCSNYSNINGEEKVTITVDYGANPGEAYWTFRLIAQ